MSDAALLDTHAFLWYSVAPGRLSGVASAFVQDRSNRIFVSSVTAWELGTKLRLGKLEQARPLVQNYHRRLAQYGFLELPFSSVHALATAELASDHKDPFDRALAAQAAGEQLPLVTQDARVASLPGVTALW